MVVTGGMSGIWYFERWKRNTFEARGSVCGGVLFETLRVLCFYLSGRLSIGIIVGRNKWGSGDDETHIQLQQPTYRGDFYTETAALFLSLLLAFYLLAWREPSTYMGVSPTMHVQSARVVGGFM